MLLAVAAHWCSLLIMNIYLYS